MPSITDLLIATLTSGRNTKKFHQILHEQEFKKYNQNSVHVALSRLHKKGYLNNSPSGWYLNKEGKRHSNRIQLLSYIESPFGTNTQPTTIVSFDIPMKDRKKRNWLRNQIKMFGYTMLQQSLWLGPGPLPLLFMKRLKKLNIRKNIKIFTIKKKLAKY